jgi:hypothetical protein
LGLLIDADLQWLMVCLLSMGSWGGRFILMVLWNDAVKVFGFMAISRLSLLLVVLRLLQKIGSLQCCLEVLLHLKIEVYFCLVRFVSQSTRPQYTRYLVAFIQGFQKASGGAYVLSMFSTLDIRYHRIINSCKVKLFINTLSRGTSGFDWKSG